MNFISRYDAALAQTAVPSVFVRTHESTWRLEPDITRDCWERHAARALDLQPKHALVRDRATGFVSWWYVGAPALLEAHPRLDAQFYETEAEAEAALLALGRPPIAPGRWPEAARPA